MLCGIILAFSQQFLLSCLQKKFNKFFVLLKFLVMRHLLLIVILLNLFMFTIQMQCNRKPQGASGPVTPVTDDFQVLIGGNPTNYVPGQMYTLSISCTSSKRFLTFTLVVENENGTISGEESVGHFELIDSINTRFSHSCENMIESTNIIGKTHIDVTWMAPPTFNSGCIKIKAAVMENPYAWFMDDGLLVKMLCPEVNEMNSQTMPLQYCCAIDEAKYELKLERIWSSNTHAKYFPKEAWRTRFSALVGASHTYDFRFWDVGTLASPGLKELAEHGSTTKLEEEIKAGLVENNIRTIIKAPGIIHRKNVVGMTLANVRVDTNHHLVSVVTKIEPSPDWILGVAGLELCLENCTWIEEIVMNMYPWDVGTDSGPSYMSPDQAQIPPDVVRRITKTFPSDDRSPFFDNSTALLKPLAILYVTRKKVYSIPDESSENGNMECATHPWTSWTKCSTLCGTGIQTRWRAYKEPRLAYLFGCNITLNQVQNCIGKECSAAQPKEIPAEMDVKPECELSEWSEWSTCSNDCGAGFIRRSRYYFNVNARSKCQKRYPMELEQSRSCMGEICGGNIQNKNENEETESGPDLFGNLDEENTYGKANSEVFEKYDDNDDDKQEFEIDSETNNYGIVPRYCLAWPVISDETCPKKQLIMKNYWFYDARGNKCMLFTTDNCDQNENKFTSMERCESVCMPHSQLEDSNAEVNEYQGMSNFGQPESQIRNDFKNPNRFSTFTQSESQNRYDYKNPNRFSENNDNQRNSNFDSQNRYFNKNNNRFRENNENQRQPNFGQSESQIRYDSKNRNNENQWNSNYKNFNQRQSNFGQPDAQIRNDFKNRNSFSEYNENQWNANLAQTESQNQYDNKNYNRFPEHNENQWNPESQNQYDYQKFNPASSSTTYNRNQYRYF